MIFSIKFDFNKCFLVLFLAILSFNRVVAQNKDTTAQIVNFRGSASVTNNGFSFIPAFSLGKPAAIFNFNINGGKRFSFEPEFRFALKNARPWSFIFIYRYKIIDRKKFQTSFGSHFPAVPFRVLAYENSPEVKNTLAVSRVIPFELTPNFIINKNNSISLFCLYAKGLSDDAVNHSTVFMLRMVSRLPLSNYLGLRFNPQLFYLQLDKLKGTYLAANFNLNSPKSRFYLGSSFNKPLKTDIAGNKLNWNISIGYALDKKLIVKN
jgi:hypothetical protein